jgi:hypothetical protein
MMKDFNLYSVNWQDGMLISEQHLRDQESHFEELARWYAVSAGDAFGLVRKSSSGKPALSLNLSHSGNRLRVGVIRCQALLPDGSYVEINESTQPPLRADLESQEPTIPVYIGVNSDDRRQVGDPDPGEEIPRVPYLNKAYVLQLGSSPSLPEGSYMQVAELKLTEGDVAYSDSFYPPCLNLYADERLMQTAGELRNRLEAILGLATRAYAALASKEALAGEKTELQLAFKETLQHMVYHLAATLDEFVVGPNAGHPIGLVIMFKRLFRMISTLLNVQPGLKDYLNEKLFVQKMKSDIRRFLSSLDSFLLTEYDHSNVGPQIAAISGNLDMFRSVLEFLSQVKGEQLGPQAMATDMLTYRGKTYRLVQYGSTRVERVGELVYLVVDIAETRSVRDAVVLMMRDLFSDAEWTAMQVRIGLNEARALGETDPVDVDITAFGNKVALHPSDMMEMSNVGQVALMFRGSGDLDKLSTLGKMDLQVYAL